jgi:hypothetical protein
MADIAKETRHPNFLEDFEISDKRSSAKSWAQAYDGKGSAEGNKDRAAIDASSSENSGDRNSKFLSEHIGKLQTLSHDDRESFLHSLLGNTSVMDKIAAAQEKFQNMLRSADGDTALRQLGSVESSQASTVDGALERQNSNPLQNKFLERELSLASSMLSDPNHLSENPMQTALSASRAVAQLGENLLDLCKITGRQELLKTNFNANCLNDTTFGARSKFLSSLSD